MILSNISQLLKQNKKIFYYLGFILAVFLFSSDVTFAATSTTDNGLWSISTLTSFIEWTLKIMSVFLGIMTYLVTMFLSPEWINGTLFGLNGYFKDIWILVSNVVYFIFAFILIWIAFMNIIGNTGEQYQLKQALPKFIVGVLIVPFSWFLVQFILSVSAILTVSAISLPVDTFKSFGTTLNDVKVPLKCEIDLSSSDKSGSTDISKSGIGIPGGFITCDEEGVSIDTLLGSGDGMSSIYGIISMYTYGIISFDTIDDINFKDLKEIKVIGDILIKLVFDALFIIIYSILIIALGLVLMIRGIYLWIYVMLSPIFGLMYFFDKKDGGEGFFAKFNIKEFIALAMVPVYTMLALSFGLLFIFVIGTGVTTGSTGGSSSTDLVTMGVESGNNFVGIGKFRLIIKGAVSQSTGDATGFLKAIGEGGLGLVGALILKLFGIVVLWGTVMAAMRSSEITKAVVEPLHAFGGKVGGIMASAPGNIPIFGGVSAKGMGQAASQVSTYFDNKSLKTGSEFVNKHMKFASNGNIDAKTLANEIRANGMSPSELKRARVMLSGKTVTEISADSSLRDLISSLGNAANIDENLQKDSTLQNKDEVAKALHAINNTKESQFTSNGRLVADRILDSGDNNANKMNILLTGLPGSGSTDDGSSVKKPKLDIQGDSAVINFNGNDKQVTKIENGVIIKLGDMASDSLSKYVFDNNLDKDSVDELYRDLSLDNITKKELDNYFWEKDGKIIFARNKTDGKDGYKKSSLDNYLNKK